MTNDQGQGVQQLMQRARDTLDEAKVLIDSHYHVGAVNRLYYACFYATSALLETKELSSSKHSGVVALFNQYFIHTNLIDVKWGKFYRNLFNARLDGDYSAIPQFTSEEINEYHEKAKTFVEEIARLIAKEQP